ncbi:hypothetical protein U1Q18_035350, partial [Sarracenia purpurea var. burkii]
LVFGLGWGGFCPVDESMFWLFCRLVGWWLGFAFGACWVLWWVMAALSGYCVA